jgi:hypothetical protein
MRSPHRGVIPTVECSHVFILFLIGSFIAADTITLQQPLLACKTYPEVFLKGRPRRFPLAFAAMEPSMAISRLRSADRLLARARPPLLAISFNVMHKSCQQHLSAASLKSRFTPISR